MDTTKLDEMMNEKNTWVKNVVILFLKAYLYYRSSYVDSHLVEICHIYDFSEKLSPTQTFRAKSFRVSVKISHEKNMSKPFIQQLKINHYHIFLHTHTRKKNGLVFQLLQENVVS